MQMPPRRVDPVHIVGEIDAHQRALHVLEAERFLGPLQDLLERHVHGPAPRLGPGIHQGELSIDSHDVHAVQAEAIVDQEVQMRLELIDVRKRAQVECLVALQVADGGKRDAFAGIGDLNRSVRRGAVADPVDHDHLPVHVLERSQPRVPMLQELRHGHHRSRIPKHERLKRGYLIHLRHGHQLQT